MGIPETQYVTTDDGVHIAYQVVGNGANDLLYLSSWDLAVDFHWEEPDQLRFFESLASFSRLIMFDKRGTGASDAISLDAMPTLESWIDDVRFVMDVVGSERAAIVAPTWVGPLALLFAATWPERTTALVLVDTWARLRSAPGHEGLTDKRIDGLLRLIEDTWGTGPEIWAASASSLAGDDRLRRWWNRCQRLTLSPAAVLAFTRMMANTDVRHVLPSIQAPTLVVSRSVPQRRARAQQLVDLIPDARLLLVESEDSLPWLHEGLAGDIEEFLTGARHSPDPDRVLATVVFTDVVGSTEHAARLGDKAWGNVLGQYDRLVDRHIRQFHGHHIKSTGDGTLATFDGPARAVRFAQSIRDSVRELGVALRCGVHTGEIERRGDDVGGIAVHIGQRVSAIAAPDEVLVSRTVVDLVAGSGLAFEDRGEHELKGVPGAWRLFKVS